MSQNILASAIYCVDGCRTVFFANALFYKNILAQLRERR